MPELVISLFGPPTIKLDGISLDAQTYKATALIAYLAVNQTAHHRIELATLLWTELGKEKALAALRTTLWKLKQAGLGSWLDIERDTVSLLKSENLSVDVLQFQDLLAQCDTHGHASSKACAACLPSLGEAADLYHGDFMKGYSLRDAGAFDAWQSQYSEQLRQEIREVLEKLVSGHRNQGELERAIFYARRRINMDRYNEDIHRDLMKLYSDAGQRSEALQQYRELVKTLQRDKIQPQQETNLLYDQILNEKTERIVSSQELETPVFLATDIENSTEMWANYRDQMVRTVARYNGIVKECASQFGGIVAKQTGDTTILYFDKGQPLHCALAIHKRLMRTTWTVNTIPRIRIALNAAENKRVNAQSYITEVYSAQRLLSAGWGGQVLLTAPVLNTVDRPENMQIIDLGVHTLKDLREPLRIYMLSHPSLPSREFPPLQSLSNYRQNLPVYPTSFIDREREQITLAELLANDTCRLLTLVGPGGVGKTRLALQVAAQQMNNFDDGVYFISFAAPRTSDLIPSILAETFKYNFFEQKDPIHLIFDYLHEKNMLLIVDNFEHLIEGATFFSSLLDHAPRIKIIVTSRERLNLHNEWIFEVQGMPFPSGLTTEPVEQFGSVQLFIHNARRMLADFNPGAEDLDAIARICTIVDGMPLAIELATAWIRTLSCQEIAREIELNLDFLSTSMRDLPPRHRSLRAVFEHSWNLLSEEGRRTYRKLSVFRGGFTTEAAFQIAKASPIELAGFVDRSLLRRVSFGRFEVIEVLRHFAEQKLRENKEDWEKTRTLHSDYYLELLDSNFIGMMGPDVGRIINIIRSEIENLRVAAEWAANTDKWASVGKLIHGLLAYLEVTGHNSRGFEIFSYALEKLEDKTFPGSEFLKSGIKLGVGWTQFCIGEHTAGMQKMQEALEDFTKLDSPMDIGTALFYLARANERLNYLKLAVTQAEKGLSLFRNDHTSDQRIIRTLIAQTLEVYGLALLKLDRPQDAKKILQESLHVSQELGQRFGSIHVLDALGGVLTAEGDYSGAISLRLQALKIAKEFGNKYSIARILTNLCHIYMVLNEFDKAMRYQQESLEISREIGNRWLTAIGLNNLAYISLKYFADSTEALRLYNESLSIFIDSEDKRGIIYTLYDMGVAAREARRDDQSHLYFLNALEKARSSNSEEMQLYVLSGLVASHVRCGETMTASELCHLILAHPQSNPETKQRTSDLLDQIDLILTQDQIKESSLRGLSASLEQVVAQFLVKA